MNQRLLRTKDYSESKTTRPRKLPLLLRLFSHALAILDRFNEIYTKILPWMVILMAAISLSVVILRYGFSENSIIVWQESLVYLHSALFMLAIPWTLKVDGHVRVDVFYQSFSASTQAWINCLGAIVLALPLTYFVFIYGLDFALRSWSILEISPEPGGLPIVYVLKSLIPLVAVLLLLQVLAEILRNLLLLITSGSSNTAAQQPSH